MTCWSPLVKANTKDLYILGQLKPCVCQVISLIKSTLQINEDDSVEYSRRAPPPSMLAYMCTPYVKNVRGSYQGMYSVLMKVYYKLEASWWVQIILKFLFGSTFELSPFLLYMNSNVKFQVLDGSKVLPIYANFPILKKQKCRLGLLTRPPQSTGSGITPGTSL